MEKNKIVSRKEWLRARRELLEEEKAFTRRRDALTRRIRELPWVKVEKNYTYGLDRFNTAYHYLDIVPKGRDEADLSYSMAWVRLQDQY